MTSRSGWTGAGVLDEIVQDGAVQFCGAQEESARARAVVNFAAHGAAAIGHNFNARDRRLRQPVKMTGKNDADIQRAG